MSSLWAPAANHERRHHRRGGWAPRTEGRGAPKRGHLLDLWGRQPLNAPDIEPLAAEFRQLWDFARQATATAKQEQRGAIHPLLPSLRHLADIVEESDAYRQFVDAPFWGSTPPSAWRVREALQRSGFYHAIQNGTEPTKVWDSLLRRLTPHMVTIQTLVLLDGCWFSTDRFSVAQTSIKRFSVDELKGLGPPEDIASTYFQAETLDHNWYTRVWFLARRDQRRVKPTSISVRFGYDVLLHFWRPLLALALYKTEYFATPIVLESNVGWRLERIRWSEPMVDIVDDHNGDLIEIPRTDYTVDEKEQSRFAAFLGFFDDAIKGAREWKAFRLAARRYLRAIQIAGAHPLSDDDYEDALLQYVIALEALLSGGDRDTIGDKLATRAAWLIGTSDTVRARVYRNVKNLYGRRSAIVHGSPGDSESTPSHVLDGARNLIRRILVGLMALRHTSTSTDECLRLLRTAAFDRRSQAAIADATQPVWPLIDAGVSRSGSTWGPRH